MTTFDGLGTTVSLPGEAAYEAATQVFNLAAPARPAAAVTARTLDQIRAALSHARAEGLPVRVHSTGHAAAATGPMEGSLLIRAELAGDVEIDASRHLARIPSGTRWGAVVEAAAPHGLAVPHGSSPTVGAVGFLLGGGLSPYGRQLGLAVNSVRAIELVTADGELRRVDATHDPDLFWALRGGGGGFGIVTAVEVELFAAAGVVTGTTYWTAEHAEPLLTRWLEWTRDAPREVTTSLRLMNLPPLPDVPPALVGSTLAVDGAVLVPATGDPAAARRMTDRLLEPLLAVAAPVMNTWAVTSLSGALEVHMDPTDPVPFAGDHMLLSDLDGDGVAEFLRLLGPGSGSPLIVAGLRHLGGAFAEPSPDGGALDHLDAPYCYAGSGVPVDAPTARALGEHQAKVRAALRPWDTGWTVPSFVESFAQPQRHLDALAVRRADLVRTRVDPDGLFRGDIAPNATALW
ncbi:FAD-binding protein [Streptosporangium sp. NBC_01639]|uniref:FAD-binding oxidoreductase n=1 Tax=Streptosporangium sp. NBC_01639 TaxID=2975948 RepID=UPI003867A3BD|nr:FAD-binding protein [Streptosporangium sp. NBC_01639]